MKRKANTKMDEDFITVRTFHSLIEVYIAKTRLESEGIEVLLLDEHISRLFPGGDVIFGVRLQVRKSDKERALEILSEDL